MNDKHKVSQAINASHNTFDVNDDKPEQVDVTPKTKMKAKAKGRKPSRATVDFNAVCQSIRASQVDCFTGQDRLCLIFHGCRVLSLNQIFTFLQKKPRPFQLMEYKELWHQKIYGVIHALLYDDSFVLPDFSNSRVKIQVFRQSDKLIDADNIYTSFKYLIDGLHEKHKIVQNSKEIEYSVIPDDNPNFVSNIEAFQLKGEDMIAIKLVRDKQDNGITSLKDFLAL